MSFFTRFRRTSDPGEDAGRKHPVAGRIATVLACLLVLFALIAPNEITRLTPGAFLRVPLEGLLFAGLVLVLPARARRIAAVPIGVVLGLLAIVKIVDLGFSAVLARPFNLVFDWPLFGAAVEFLHASVGVTGAVGAAIVAVVLALAVLVLMTLSVLRLTRLVVAAQRHGGGASVAVFGVVWVVCAALGAQIVPGVPVAGVATGGCYQVRTSLQDREDVRQGGRRRRLPAHPERPVADRAARQGRHAHLRGELRAQRDRGPEIAPQVDALLDAGTAGSARPDSARAARSSPRRPRAAEAGSRTPRCCPVCGSTTSSATAAWSRATG